MRPSARDSTAAAAKFLAVCLTDAGCDHQVLPALNTSTKRSTPPLQLASLHRTSLQVRPTNAYPSFTCSFTTQPITPATHRNRRVQFPGSSAWSGQPCEGPDCSPLGIPSFRLLFLPNQKIQNR